MATQSLRVTNPSTIRRLRKIKFGLQEFYQLTTTDFCSGAFCAHLHVTPLLQGEGQQLDGGFRIGRHTIGRQNRIIVKCARLLDDDGRRPAMNARRVRNHRRAGCGPSVGSNLNIRTQNS